MSESVTVPTYIVAAVVLGVLAGWMVRAAHRDPALAEALQAAAPLIAAVVALVVAGSLSITL